MVSTNINYFHFIAMAKILSNDSIIYYSSDIGKCYSVTFIEAFAIVIFNAEFE